jgi:hypothetical protein
LARGGKRAFKESVDGRRWGSGRGGIGQSEQKWWYVVEYEDVVGLYEERNKYGGGAVRCRTESW